MDKITFTDGVTKLNKATMDTFQNNIDNGKVDKITGKGLSTNDYTTEEKTKLSGIETGANKTVINNTLTSTSTTQAASANTVKTLNDTIGNIIESGSNTNGSYIKWSDGTMICYKHMDYGEKTITKEWGSFYESDKLTIGNYPQAFIEIPRIFIMDLNYSFIEKESSSITKTAWGDFFSTRPVSTTQRVIIDCFAIGKWK